MRPAIVREVWVASLGIIVSELIQLGATPITQTDVDAAVAQCVALR